MAGITVLIKELAILDGALSGCLFLIVFLLLALNFASFVLMCALKALLLREYSITNVRC